METKIKKNQTAKVGEKYSYKYVDIAQIHDYLETINSRYIQKIERIDGDDYVFTKRCFGDKWEEEWLQGCRVVQATLMGNNNPAQQQGSALTYARRYSLLMAYGLATEDDDAQCLSTPKEITKEMAENYVFQSGKHKGEKLIDLIIAQDGYIDWLLAESKNEEIKQMITLLTGQVEPNDEEDKKEKLYLMQKLNKIFIDKDIDRDGFYERHNVMSMKEVDIQTLKEWIKEVE